MKNFYSRLVFCFIIAELILISSPAFSQSNKNLPVQIMAEDTFQTVVGFGAALAYYEGWLTAHPNKNQIYEAIFGELSLDILRVRNAYDYDSGMVDRVKEFTTAAEKSLGKPIAVLSTSWGPPAYLKSNNDRKNGGTLKFTKNGTGVDFDYSGKECIFINLKIQMENLVPDDLLLKISLIFKKKANTCFWNKIEL